MKRKTLGAQRNPRGEDRHRSTPYLVLKDTNQGLKGKAEHIHTRKKCELDTNCEYT